MALESLFSYLAREGKITPEEALSHVFEEVEDRPQDEFSSLLVKTACDNLGKTKVIIRAFAPEFPLKKIAPINRVILIMGITEMKFMDTPPIVVINEYIELAKIFGEEKSGGFINGVLDNFRSHLGLERTDKKGKNKEA
jgi:N utilization substance protein B